MTKTIFQFDIEHIIGLVSGLLIILAQLNYLSKLKKKEVEPSPLSWGGWSILMGTSFVSQLMSQGWSLNLFTLLLSTIGAFVIAFSARFIFKHYSIVREDWKYLYYGLACILLYAVLKDEWLTTIFAIIADLILAVPTFRKAYYEPEKEKSSAWLFGFAAWTLTLSMLIFNFSWIHVLWPTYLILFHGTMTYLTYVRNKA